MNVQIILLKNGHIVIQTIDSCLNITAGTIEYTISKSFNTYLMTIIKSYENSVPMLDSLTWKQTYLICFP